MAVGLDGERGEPVERPVDLGVRAAPCAPDIPRQHDVVVERGDVADDVAGDEPQPVHVEDAEGVGIGRAGAAALPGIARHQELVARHVERIEGILNSSRWRASSWASTSTQALRSSFQYSRHPVVEELARLEIGAEAAAGAGAHAGAAQHGDMQQREVAADADLPLIRWAGGGQRARVVRHDLAHDLLDRADMRLGMLGLAQVQAVGRARYARASAGPARRPRVRPGPSADQ